eukprot:GSChrysophyteH1.ASY1.ANO1.2808.1 assembled CDS
MSGFDSMESEQAQQMALATSMKVVRDQSILMQRAIDGGNLKVTLDYATEMLRELRSSVLTPKNYYELYMNILDQMRTPIVNIYEQVQSCGNVVPRLYLLCCVGGVYIQSMEAPAKDVLRDLVEMLKGVQHPMRGLFLRNYLTQISKNRLPDLGTPFEGVGGTVQDAFNFILLNFAETNRLWVRLQTQKENQQGKNKKQRERERQDLRILVGANLVRLSQLEGLTAEEYKEKVLPTILEEVVNCRDTIAQTYLMDCIIQVFPDDFHLLTLKEFLQTCTSLNKKVNVRAIVEAMTDRLADVPAFRVFNDCKTDFAKAHDNGDDIEPDPTTLQIERILMTPMNVFALKVLEMPAYTKLLSHLPWANWTSVASSLVKQVIKSGTVLSDIDQVDQLFQALSPLLRARDGAPAPVDEDGVAIPPTEKFIKEQKLMARLVHLFQHDDTDQLLRIYVNARTHYSEGGHQRVRYTVPPLVTAALSLTRRVKQREIGAAADPPTADAPQYSSKKILLYVLELIDVIIKAGFAEDALPLYLLAAKAADECGLHKIAFEFFKEAPIIYEEEIIDSKKQVRALTAMIGTLTQCVNFDEEQYDILSTKLGQYSNKLLKKPDQCRMISLCSHLFYPPKSEDGTNRFAEQPNIHEKALECMRRAIKVIKDKNLPASVVEVLSRYVYHLEHDTPLFEAKFLTGLVKFINEEFGDDLANSPAIEHFYRNTLAYIRLKQNDAVSEVAERFRAIQL